MVDVAHDGDDRRTRLQHGRVVRHVEQALFHVGFRHAAHGMAHFLGEELGGVGVEHVVDGRHLPLLHQQANDVDRALGHAVGQFLDGDRLGDRDFTHQLFFRLVRSMALEPLGAAAERGDRAFAHLVGAQCGDERETAALLFGAGARSGRTRGDRTRGAATGTARHPRRFFFLGFEGRTGGRRLLHFILAEALLGDFAGLALGFFVVLAALFFVVLARFRGFALGLLDLVTAGADLGLFLGDLALFRLAHAAVGKRMGARGDLFLGQAAQHDARRLRRLGRRGGGSGGGACLGGGRLLLRRLDRLRFCLGFRRRADHAAFDLLDHDLLAAAMAEALTHDARLRARLQAQFAAGHAQLLLARVLRFAHSVLIPRAPPLGACVHNPRLGLVSGPKALVAPCASEKRLGPRPRKQGCMYHIWAVQCQIQLLARKCFNNHDFLLFFVSIAVQGAG